jgi:hypothetical protein
MNFIIPASDASGRLKASPFACCVHASCKTVCLQWLAGTLVLSGMSSAKLSYVSVGWLEPKNVEVHDCVYCI